MGLVAVTRTLHALAAAPQIAVISTCLVVLSSLVVVACGSARRAPSSAISVALERELNPTKSSVHGPVPPSPAIAGDYDADDELDGRRANDRDGDDMSHPTDPDRDADSSARGYYDTDDRSVRQFGPAANGPTRRAIVRMLKAYFKTAANGDGAQACPMMTHASASSLVGALAGPSGPPYAHGSTCAAVASSVFEHYHRQLTAEFTRLTVGDVRVRDGHGEVVMAFQGLPGRQIDVTLEKRSWRVAEMLDRELP